VPVAVPGAQCVRGQLRSDIPGKSHKSDPWSDANRGDCLTDVLDVLPRNVADGIAEVEELADVVTAAVGVADPSLR
jgi:hypothetical protein